MQRRRIRVTMLMIQDILIKAMISSFCESMYLSYFRFQSNAWQNEGDIFTHKSHNEEGASFFFLFICFLKKSWSCLKVSLLLKTIRVLQRILTIFVKSKQLYQQSSK